MVGEGEGTTEAKPRSRGLMTQGKPTYRALGTRHTHAVSFTHFAR